MADLPIDPFALLNKSQKMALGVAGDAFDALLAVGRTATQPEEAVRQLSTLVAAVGDLASASVQPLQDVIVRQREVAETMASLATAQSELAQIIESLAQKHAAFVESLESLSAPFFGLVVKDEAQE
jgi:hypothetical protein